VKIINLTANKRIYTSNVYLLTGDWNRMEDINTLVDAGRDPDIIEAIYAASTGIGKKKVEQLIITHSHYDHASLLNTVKDQFNARVYAYSSCLQNVDHQVKGGEMLKIADQMGEILYSPGHSTDSICVYCEAEGILFAGDTPLIVRSPGGSFEAGYVKFIESLCRRQVQKIYFGHGAPLTEGCSRILQVSLRNIYASTITCKQ